ncbi:DUF3971 domain-containing protein [Sulfurimonas xiamenensis]|uniref:DUF3971 domain-containing protein n=1 Tax=Sulfurimonas xiamenensis TaxID=2590021 RepID=A0AAJ4A3L2_9BACT|nr:DUF3971 domain-containing protein [Sulfurimonas xiamenensis]
MLDAKKRLEFNTALNISIKDNAKFNLYAYSDTKKLSYKIESKEDIKNAKDIVDLFNLNPKIKYWVYDAIEMSSLSLKAFYGWFEYKNLDKAYLNLHAKAVANNLNYTYDKKVAPVLASSTELEFKNGVLSIRPQNAYSYNFFLDKSWLKIDFSKKEELLTLYLLFKGKVNKDLLTLLNRYRIKIPFVQKKGEVDTNLTLDINLRTLNVKAAGKFYAKEAQIEYLGLDIDIFDAYVFLNNTLVEVNNMGAKYKNIATSHVDLNFDAKKSKGELSFKFDAIDLKENNITLANPIKPFIATYTISPKQDYLKIDISTWKYKNQILHVDAIKLPFDIKNLTASIPYTKIESPKMGSASLSGDIFFQTKKADLNIKLLKIDYSDISLNKTSPSFHWIYEKNRSLITSKDPIILSIDNKKINIDNLIIDTTSEYIKVQNLDINFQNSVKSKISINYNLKNFTGVSTLQNIEIKDSEFGEIFKIDKNIELFIEKENNKISINSKEYDFEYTLSENDWIINLNSFEKIAPYSNLLRKYDLTNGNFKLEKTKNEKDINFSLNTDYKYKFLATEKEPIKSYTINGSFNKETNRIMLSVNDIVAIEIKDDIKIKADSAGINIKEVINFFTDKKSEKETKENIDLYFDANNSYLYLGNNRLVISDTMKLKYQNKDLRADLKYKEGSAVFKLGNDKMYLYGDKFNDQFMDKLFALSKFRGGSFEFYINGTIKEYNGTIYIKEATILDYKILNNILAFVNTVPSLVTFSLPGYNKNGIAAEKAYINFKFKDDIYKMSDIYLKSKEIEITGIGEASIEKNSINMDLNLKTDLGSSVSKIPLIGHILLGKETVSTTLKVTGALDNPDVSTQIAKDIAVAPFNIIKRTLMYPFELFKSEDKESE